MVRNRPIRQSHLIPRAFEGANPELRKDLNPNRSTLQMILKIIQYRPGDRPTAERLVQEFGEKACCIAGPDELEAVEQSANSIDDSLDMMMKERNLPQTDRFEPNQEKIKAASFQKERFIAGLNEDDNRLQTSGGEEEYQFIDAFFCNRSCGIVGADILDRVANWLPRLPDKPAIMPDNS
jgi:hypothetical protein